MWPELYDGIILSSDPDSRVIFSKRTALLLFASRQLSPNSPEAGGLLLGSVRGNHFEVRCITSPFKNDSASRFHFERKDLSHVKFAKRLRIVSKNKVGYIGEWHSHPEDFPSPSLTDLAEWKKIYKKLKFPVLFMIVGRKGFYLKRIG